MRKLLTFAAFSLVASSVAASHVAGTKDSVNEAGIIYTNADAFERGLTGVYVGVSDYVADTHFLAHCASGSFVRADATPEALNVESARRVVVGMIANAHQEIFQDVADRLNHIKFVARVGSTKHDACVCGGSS
jgi:hypothetical protein